MRRYKSFFNRFRSYGNRARVVVKKVYSRPRKKKSNTLKIAAIVAGIGAAGFLGWKLWQKYKAKQA